MTGQSFAFINAGFRFSQFCKPVLHVKIGYGRISLERALPTEALDESNYVYILSLERANVGENANEQFITIR